MSVRRFASCVVEVDNEVVGKLTQYGKSTTVSEEMVSGSEDTTENDVILEQYIPVSVGKTANIAGVSLVSDDGQDELEDVADEGKDDVVLKFRNADGSGEDQAGFFTNYEKTGELSANVFRFTAQFRVNEKTLIDAS